MANTKYILPPTSPSFFFGHYRKIHYLLDRQDFFRKGLQFDVQKENVPHFSSLQRGVEPRLMRSHFHRNYQKNHHQIVQVDDLEY